VTRQLVRVDPDDITVVFFVRLDYQLTFAAVVLVVLKPRRGVIIFIILVIIIVFEVRVCWFVVPRGRLVFILFDAKMDPHECPNPGLSLCACQLFSWNAHAHPLSLLQKAVLPLFICSDIQLSKYSMKNKNSRRTCVRVVPNQSLLAY
jgi:hypothetical protein